MASHSGLRGGLIALIVLLVGVLVVMLVNLVPLVTDRPAAREPNTVRQEVTAGVPLQDAYARAVARVGEWVEDAALVRAESSWYATPGWEDMAVPPLAWGFLFYSPSEGELATVVVGDTDLLWVPPASIPVKPVEIEAFPPAYTPDLVWVTFLAAGGDAFLRVHPQAQVTFRLSPEQAGLTWTVSAYQDDASIDVSLDAESGIVTAAQE